jgi:hypothetical protein
MSIGRKTVPPGSLSEQAVQMGLWLTPRANESGEGQRTFLKRMGDRTEHCHSSLTAQAKALWATPTSRDSQGRQVLAERAGERAARSAGLEWITGPDGKSRPVEPGICLLADGVPARVGKLRAYGNAIVPQLAAEFIRAARRG